MKKFFVITIFLLSLPAWNVRADNPAPEENTLYNPDPNHIWNRLNDVLFLRTGADGKKYGLEEPDILYWVSTKNLLVEPSHSRALGILDEFINSHSERLVADPLKRALLQRDLWELFDWSAMPWLNMPHAKERKELQCRLAIVIHRLALTTNEIASLPDNYAQAEQNHLPDLPQGLFETNGDWVNLSAGYPGQGVETAPAHDHSSGACSPFLVLIRTPEGRQATTNYLNQLDNFDRVWVYVTNNFNNRDFQELTFSPDLPQFPADTEFALVRRMCVVDTEGEIRPTPVVISIQKRHYLAIARPTFLTISNRLVQVPPQKFYEFRIDRAQDAAVRAVAENERDFRLFDSMGFDAFGAAPWERTPPQDPSQSTYIVLKDCASCHIGPGIYSVNSYIRLFSPRYTDPPKLFPSDINSVMNATIDWKRTQYNWGLLQGLWNQNPSN